MQNQLRQKMAMLHRWMKILSRTSDVAIKQGPGKAYSMGAIKGYYNDMTGKVSRNTPLDSEGIPLSVIAGGEQVHFPIAVFQYALGCYDLYLLSDKTDTRYLDAFLRCADWALTLQAENGSWDAFGPLHSTLYTVSSMAQGEGASVLVRAYVSTGDDRYLMGAFSACNFMLIPIEDGGTCIYYQDGLALEEYPQSPRRGVLNGWIFSLFGLYDASILEPSYSTVFINSVDKLCLEIDNYDTGYWSLYDLTKRMASPAYHDIHIAQLSVLGEIAGRPLLIKKANEFAQYKNNKVNVARAIGIKAIQKLIEHSDAVVLR